MDKSIEDAMKYVQELPPNHPYRIHLEQHVDLVNKRVIRLDPTCEDCKIYRE